MEIGTQNQHDDKKMTKEPFIFQYTMPSLDWYETIQKEVKWEDYIYFKIQYRFGERWWLLGYKEKDGRFEHEEVEIGELRKPHLKKFIEWCEFDYYGRKGSKLIGVGVISTGMNLMEIFKSELMGVEA